MTAPDDFFQLGLTYTIGGYQHTIRCIVPDSMFGPLAWATFRRPRGIDVQTLGIGHWNEWKNTRT